MQPILEIKNLTVSTKRKSLVKGVSFKLFEGECLALIGESGSGKTTVAQSILQLQTPEITIEGEIIFEGKNLLGYSYKEMEAIRAKKIGMVFQDPATSLNPTMQIGRQITEALGRNASSKSKAYELLELVGIDHPKFRAEQYPFQISGGMQQRVLIAMALACGPKILIADEPTSALDATTQFQILALLNTIQKKCHLSILFITHDLDAISHFCGRAMIMKSGEIVEEEKIQELFQNPCHSYTKALLEASHASFS